MRVFARAAAIAAAASFVVLTSPPALQAQEAATAAGGDAGASAALPSRPIPYTQLARPSVARTPVARRRPPARLAPSRPAPPAVVAPAQRPGARLAPAEPIPPVELEAFVDGVVRQGMATGRVPGVAVTVVQNGQVVLEKGYGSARPGRAVDPRATLFRLGSISKVFTSIALLKAVEEGRLKLDDPVNAHLPPALRLRDEGFRQPVRIRDLLAHTSGFEAREAGRLFQADPDRVRSLSDMLRTNRPHRVRAAGELASYANMDAAIAGAVLEQVSGRAFDDLIDANLLTPLKLAHTSFREAYPQRENLPAPLAVPLAEAQAAGFGAQGPAPVANSFAGGFGPAVGASGTADDMGRLMQALLGFGWLEGTQAWGPGAEAALRSPLNRPAPGVNGWPGGLMQTALPGGFTAYGHGGAAPGFRASLSTAPDLRLGVFAVGNSESAGPLVDTLAARLAERFYGPPAPPLPAGDTGLARQRAVFEGDYLSSRRAHHGLEKFVDHLSRLAHVRIVDGRLSITEGRQGEWFSSDGGTTPGVRRFQAVAGPAAVVFAVPKGRAESFTPANNIETFQRVGLIFSPRTLAWSTLVVVALSLAVLAVGVVRAGRESRRSAPQTLAGGLQAAGALGWLGSVVAFLIWRSQARDAVTLMLDWPGGWLVTASTLALVAAVLALLSMPLLPQVWRSDRRGAGWSGARKLGHTAVALMFLAFAALLAVWGALAPWSA